MIELPRIEQWLHSLLSADTELATQVGARIYAYIAPQCAAMPYVILSHQGGHDVRGVGPGRIMVSAMYQVKVVGPAANMAALVTAADRLDTLLQAASGAVTDGAVWACVREQPLAYVEVDSGAQYRHLGGLYRIMATAWEVEPEPEEPEGPGEPDVPDAPEE